MNLSKVFAFDESIVRVAGTPENPLFVAADLCRVLGIENSRDAVSRMPDDEKDEVGLTDSIGRNQMMQAVKEAGLYRLIFRSNKPSAQKFQKWVFGVVLPEIRKSGRYEVDNTERLWTAFGQAKSAQVQRIILEALGIAGTPLELAEQNFMRIEPDVIFGDIRESLQAEKLSAEFFRVNPFKAGEVSGFEFFISPRVIELLRQLNPERYRNFDRRDLMCSLRLAGEWMPGKAVQRMGLLKEPEHVWRFKVIAEGVVMEICKWLANKSRIAIL